MFVCSLLENLKTSKNQYFPRFFREATTGFEPVMEVLQTCALPLGYVAVFNFFWLRSQ